MNTAQKRTSRRLQRVFRQLHQRSDSPGTVKGHNGNEVRSRHSLQAGGSSGHYVAIKGDRGNDEIHGSQPVPAPCQGLS